MDLSESWDIDVPSTTTKLKFAFISGAWDEEVTFQITDPDGNVVISTDLLQLLVILDMIPVIGK